jgi:hypothetical protein
MTPDGTFGKVIETPGGTFFLGPNGETARAVHVDNGYGRLYCWYQGVLYVQGRAEDANDNWYVLRFGSWAFFGENPPIPLPAPPVLPRVVTRGAFFALENGQRVTVIEATDFALFQRFLAGEDITPVLAQRKELGFNTLRVLGMCQQMFRLFPQEHGNYYEQLAAFANLVASFGLYIEFVVFADATVVMPDAGQQVAFWQLVGVVAQKLTNVSLELGNELDQPINRLAAVNVVAPTTGVLCSRGSNGSQVPAVRDPFVAPLQAGASGWWNYETFHTNDAFEWWRKAGHNAMELSDGARYPDGSISIPASHVPALTNENTRPDKDGNINHFYDAAAGAALLCAGSCYHCEGGKFSRLFDASEHQFASAWVAGAKSVPLEFQDGRYIRRDDLLTADLLRIYERRLNDGRGFIVKIRK